METLKKWASTFETDGYRLSNLIAHFGQDDVNAIGARDGWTPKTQQSERLIPLNADLLDMIRRLPKAGAYVFPGPDPDTPIGNMRKAFASAAAAADIQRRGKPVSLTPKVLRKAHATWQVERGINESVLQGLLGHAKGSRVTKQFYVHVSEEAKRAAMITLPMGERIAK